MPTSAMATFAWHRTRDVWWKWLTEEKIEETNIKKAKTPTFFKFHGFPEGTVCHSGL